MHITLRVMSATAAKEAEILTGRLFSVLLDYLHVGDVRPHLLTEKVITREEYEQLQVGHSLTSERKVAESLVFLLSRKPKGATRLLEALEKTVTGDNPQTAHHTLVDELKRELGRCGELHSDGSEALSPVPYQHSLSSSSESRRTRGELRHEDSDDSAIESIADLIPNPGASNEPIALLRYKPYLDSHSQENLRVRLASESRSILEEFTSFVLDVGAQLQSTSTDIEEIKLALEARLGKDVNNRTLQRIEEANTVPRLLRIAMPFSSWYNYDLVAYLAKRYGGTRGEELVANYEKHFEAHLKKRVVTCPPVLSDDAAVPNGFQKFVVVVDWKFEDCTLQDVTIFKEKLCKHLHIDDPARFILKSILEGCVRLSFILPTSMAEHTWARAIAVKAELVEEQVISIHMEGKSLNFKEEVCQPPEVESENSTADTLSATGHHTSFSTPDTSPRLLELASQQDLPTRRTLPLSSCPARVMKGGRGSHHRSPTKARRKLVMPGIVLRLKRPPRGFYAQRSSKRSKRLGSSGGCDDSYESVRTYVGSKISNSDTESTVSGSLIAADSQPTTPRRPSGAVSSKTRALKGQRDVKYRKFTIRIHRERLAQNKKSRWIQFWGHRRVKKLHTKSTKGNAR